MKIEFEFNPLIKIIRLEFLLPERNIIKPTLDKLQKIVDSQHAYIDPTFHHILIIQIKSDDPSYADLVALVKNFFEKEMLAPSDYTQLKSDLDLIGDPKSDLQKTYSITLPEPQTIATTLTSDSSCSEIKSSSSLTVAELAKSVTATHTPETTTTSASEDKQQDQNDEFRKQIIKLVKQSIQDFTSHQEDKAGGLIRISQFIKINQYRKDAIQILRKALTTLDDNGETILTRTAKDKQFYAIEKVFDFVKVLLKKHRKALYYITNFINHKKENLFGLLMLGKFPDETEIQKNARLKLISNLGAHRDIVFCKMHTHENAIVAAIEKNKNEEILQLKYCLLFAIQNDQPKRYQILAYLKELPLNQLYLYLTSALLNGANALKLALDKQDNEMITALIKATETLNTTQQQDILKNFTAKQLDTVYELATDNNCHRLENQALLLLEQVSPALSPDTHSSALAISPPTPAIEEFKDDGANDHIHRLPKEDEEEENVHIPAFRLYQR